MPHNSKKTAKRIARGAPKSPAKKSVAKKTSTKKSPAKAAAAQTKAPQPTAVPLTERLAAFRARVDAGTSAEVHNNDRALPIDFEKLLFDYFGKWRPYPVRRPSELTGDQRSILTFMVQAQIDGSELWCLGLPRHFENGWAKDFLRQFLGMKTALPVDELVTLKDETHPLWALVSDVAYALRPAPAVLDAFFTSLSVNDLAAAWKQLVRDDVYGIQHMIYPQLKDAIHDQDYEDFPLWRPMMARLVSFLVAFGVKLGKASAVTLSELGKPNGRYEPAFAAVVLLSLAVVRGETLDKKSDPLFQKAFAGHDPLGLEIVRLLKNLPADHAEKLVSGHTNIAALWSERTKKKKTNTR